MKYKKEIKTLAIPAMFENILQMLMGVVDNYLVAHIGLIAVSGVSVANNIIIIYQAIFIALGSAVSSLVAKSRTGRRQEIHTRYLADSLSMTLVLSVILGVLSYFFGKSFLEILGTSPEVTQAGDSYLKIVGGFIVSMGLTTTFGAILRAQGHPKLPMYVSFVTNIINVILSSLAIFVFHFGIVGVSFSTVFSRLIGLYLLGRQLPILEMIRDLRFKVSKELIGIALPSAGERLMMRAGDVVVIAIIVDLGTKVVAGHAIGETITQFNYMPGLAIATATVILIAQTLSDSQKDDISTIVKESYLVAVGSMSLISLLIYLNGVFLTSVFTKDSVAQASSLIVILYSLVGVPFTAGTLVYTAVWQGIGKANLPFYATTIGMWGIRVVFGYILSIPFGMGIAGVCLATVLDNLFRAIFLRYMFKKIQKKRRIILH